MIHRRSYTAFGPRLLPILIVAVVCLLTFGPARVRAGEAVFPGSTWETIPPTDLNAACRDQLAQVRDLLQKGATTALVAVQDGRILFSYGPTERTSIIASARKSVLAMMYGKYVADGTINLGRTLADLGMDDVGGLLPIEREATVRDLLTARSAVYHPSSNGSDDLAFAPPRGSQRPGSYFLYNNWGFNAAGAAFEIMTGQDLYRAFEADIGNPLQLQDYRAAAHRRDAHGDVTRSRYRPYHFVLSTRDMARIGYLMLQRGNWRGRQLIPADWVTRITTRTTASADMHPAKTAAYHLNYGYLWWVFDEPETSPLAGAYTAWGQLGQFILVIPKRHMVIAHKREAPDSGSWEQPGIPRVRESEFLAVARLLATAPCSSM